MLVYDECGIQIHCGDCRDILPVLPRSNAVISDPPYGVGLADWDIPVDQTDLDICRACADVVMWFGAAPPTCIKHILSFSPLADRILIWHNPFTRTTSDGAFWQYQPIYVWGETSDLGKDVLINSSNDSGSWHPAQKPEGLMRKLILSAVPEGGTVIDPFCGSGTTLRAAKDCGRKAIGIERLDKYCDIAARRLSQEVFQW